MTAILSISNLIAIAVAFYYGIRYGQANERIAASEETSQAWEAKANDYKTQLVQIIANNYKYDNIRSQLRLEELSNGGSYQPGGEPAKDSSKLN